MKSNMKNSTDVLIAVVSDKGLPVRISTRGRISESKRFAFRGGDVPMVASAESLKADFIVSNADTEEPAFTELESLMGVIRAMINGQFQSEDLIVVNADGTKRFVWVQIGDEPETTSHDFELLVSEQKFIDELNQIGVEVDIDDLDDELPELCLTHGETLSDEMNFTSMAGAAVVEFSDGSTVTFGKRNGWIVIDSASASD